MEFLQGYRHVEFGRTRELDGSEIALVLTVIDRFLMDDSFADLGFAEFTDLAAKLASIAALSDSQIDKHGFLIRSASFDAMACLKALEARLSRRVHRRAIYTWHAHGNQPAANDG